MNRIIGDYIIEVTGKLSGARDLREAILNLTYILIENPAKKGLLVISESRVTKARIEHEWQKAQSSFRPEIMERIFLVQADRGEYMGLPPDFSSQTRQQLDQVVSGARLDKGRAMGDRFSYYNIARALLLRWLRNEGPTTVLQLTQQTGYSYPTVAKSLQRLNRYVRRHSDRKIELSRFPHDEWARLVAVADNVRKSSRFVDRSGRPRSTESLLKKLTGLNRLDIAIGGVYGAKYHDPEFDLVGSPRLDLTISCYRESAKFEFVTELDAALEPSENLSETATVVVHVDRIPSHLFYKATNGWLYADPIECLLDLHEARLESQAAEFLEKLMNQRLK